MKYRNKWKRGEDDESPQFEKIFRKTPRNDYAELDETVKVKRQPRFWQQESEDEEGD